MKIFKKAIIVAALLACWAVSPAKAYAEKIPVISLSSGYGSESDNTDVRVNIESEGISAYSIEVCFDPDVLQFMGARQGDALDGGTFYCNDDYSSGIVRLVWSDSRNQKCGGSAAVLSFRAVYGTAGTQTQLSVGRSQIANDLQETRYASEDCVMEITDRINKGDVNDDGMVNTADVVYLNKYLLNSEENPLTYRAQANADLSGNGKITSVDSALIMSYVSMKIKEL